MSPMEPIAVLVNNAASDDRHAIESVTKNIGTTVRTSICVLTSFSAQAVVEGMKTIGGGSIINLSSNSSC